MLVWKSNVQIHRKKIGWFEPTYSIERRKKEWKKISGSELSLTPDSEVKLEVEVEDARCCYKWS